MVICSLIVDDARVILPTIEGVAGSDYMNASYMNVSPSLTTVISVFHVLINV